MNHGPWAVVHYFVRRVFHCNFICLGCHFFDEARQKAAGFGGRAVLECLADQAGQAVDAVVVDGEVFLRAGFFQCLSLLFQLFSLVFQFP